MKCIAVDWGSSSFRAYLIDEAGRLADRVANAKGVFTHTEGNFEATLLAACGAWLDRWPGLPVIMAGMIGSRSGWWETPYAPCPVDRLELSRRLCALPAVKGVNLQLVPGISGHSPNGAPDVMRGEEVQVFGALALTNTPDAIVCLPGTHSKWVQVNMGRIEQFSTFFTGELFALLKQHSSIAAIMKGAAEHEESVDEDAFLQGVAYSRQNGGFLHHIFSARARVLTGDWQSGSLSAYLSGMLIGHELAGASVLYPSAAPLLVVGNARLQALYQRAADAYGYPVITVDADHAIVTGLCALAEDNLLPQKDHLC